MALSTVTAPTVTPVTLAALKEHLRLTGTDEDSPLAIYLGAATAWVEDFTRRCVINRTLKLTLDLFPYLGQIELPRPNVSSVTFVKYYNTDGTLTTLSADDYWTVLNEPSGPGLIILKSSADWPDLQEDRPRAVEVTFVAGYGAATTDVPDDVRQAVMLLAAHLFENRVPIITGTIVSPVGFTVEALLHARRFHSFA